MKPFFVLTDSERDLLYTVLDSVGKDPYEDYPAFALAVTDLVDRGDVPAFFTDVCTSIRKERESGFSDAHALRNCPIDAVIPVLDQEDPTLDKYKKKKTFVSEALLELFGQLVQTPLLAYSTRFRGDFFTDVIAINRYSGKQTGFSDGELVYHNERTAHRSGRTSSRSSACAARRTSTSTPASWTAAPCWSTSPRSSRRFSAGRTSSPPTTCSPRTTTTR